MAEKNNKDIEWEDPIVEEVRAVRDAHAKKFDYDLDAIFKDLLKSQAEHELQGFKYVTLKPKKFRLCTGTES